MRFASILILIVAAVCSSALAQSTAPTTRTMYFTAVTKKGQPATVTAETLEADPGISVKSVQALGSVPISYMLVLDVSNSSRDQFAAQRRLAKKILAEVVRPQVDTGFLVLFDTKAYLGRGVTTQPELIAQALDNTRPGGGTALHDALVAGAEKFVSLAPPNQPRVLFLITDGDDNNSRATRSDAIVTLMRSNIQAFCLTFNESYSSRTRGAQALRQIAELTGGTATEMDGERDIEKAVAALRTKFSSWYRIEVEVPASKKIGFYPLRIRSRDKSITLQIPSSYLIEKQAPTTTSVAPESSPAVVK